VEPIITEDVIAGQTPETQVIIRLLLARIAELEAENAELRRRIEELERPAKGKTPRNSSRETVHGTFGVSGCVPWPRSKARVVYVTCVPCAAASFGV